MACKLDANQGKQRILFIAPNRIGDAILTTGVLSHLVVTYPDAHFTIACSPLNVALFKGVPRLERIIILKKQPYKKHWWQFWLATVGTRWDLIVDVRNSLFSRLLFRRKLACRLSKGDQHTVLANAATLKLDPPPSPQIFLSPSSRSEATQLLGCCNGQTVIGVGPAANWSCKQWPVERYIALLRWITSEKGTFPDAAIAVVAAPHERNQVETLLKAFPRERVIDLIGQNLLTAAACLARCRFFVGNDSGLMHLAAAMGTPTLGLFGPTNECHYGPWGPRNAIVRTQEGCQELRDRLANGTTPNLMLSLSVGTVIEAVKKMEEQGKLVQK